MMSWKLFFIKTENSAPEESIVLLADFRHWDNGPSGEFRIDTGILIESFWEAKA
ncbi:MAG: hypothetical protein Kow0042_17490 [Calditrichia bacterium]